MHVRAKRCVHIPRACTYSIFRRSKQYAWPVTPSILLDLLAGLLLSALQICPEDIPLAMEEIGGSPECLTIPSLLTQVGNYLDTLPGGTVPSNDLPVMFIGSNDL